MKKQNGFTLIEIMISLLIGLIIIAATITIYVNTIKSSTDTIRSVRLNHDLDSALSLMENDIKRAGYWGGAIAGANSQLNPFTVVTTAPITNVQIPTPSCILYSYDGGNGITGGVAHDANGIVNLDEYYGFRLTTNGAIEMRLTVADTASVGCNNGEWQALTINDTSGERINITRLQFSFNPIPGVGDLAFPILPATSKCLNTASLVTTAPFNTLCADAAVGYLTTGQRAIETRQVNVVITGQLANDPSVTKTVYNSVKIRNDRIFTQ